MSSGRPRHPVPFARPTLGFGPLVLFVLLPLLASCESRVDDEYRGSSLLHIEGRVVIADAEAGDDLIPALAFPSHHGTLFVDVDVRGDFPNNFSLDVYEPPPASAIYSSDDSPLIPQGTHLAIAYITAMPRNHPDRMVLAKEVYSVPNSELPACATTPACDHVERWCVDEQQLDCRLVGLPSCDGDCQPVLSEGNQSIQLNDDTPGSFAGLSERHVLLWTRDGMSKSSIWLSVLGVKEDLPPGYSLIALGTPRPRESSACTMLSDSGESVPCDDSSPWGPSIEPPPVSAETCLGEECAELFEEEALAQYNRTHGTNYGDLDSLWQDDSSGELDSVYDEVQLLSLQLAMDHGFDISEYPGTVVIRDPNTRLTVRISPDVEPLL